MFSDIEFVALLYFLIVNSPDSFMSRDCRVLFNLITGACAGNRTICMMWVKFVLVKKNAYDCICQFKPLETDDNCCSIIYMQLFVNHFKDLFTTNPMTRK